LFGWSVDCGVKIGCIFETAIRTRILNLSVCLLFLSLSLSLCLSLSVSLCLSVYLTDEQKLKTKIFLKLAEKNPSRFHLDISDIQVKVCFSEWCIPPQCTTTIVSLILCFCHSLNLCVSHPHSALSLLSFHTHTHTHTHIYIYIYHTPMTYMHTHIYVLTSLFPRHTHKHTHTLT
jgi:hypothetical protein